MVTTELTVMVAMISVLFFFSAVVGQTMEAERRGRLLTQRSRPGSQRSPEMCERREP